MKTRENSKVPNVLAETSPKNQIASSIESLNKTQKKKGSQILKMSSVGNTSKSDMVMSQLEKSLDALQLQQQAKEALATSKPKTASAVSREGRIDIAGSGRPLTQASSSTVKERDSLLYQSTKSLSSSSGKQKDLTRQSFPSLVFKEKFCTDCGTAYPAPAKYCMECGHKRT
jgi:hypothetical protein